MEVIKNFLLQNGIDLNKARKDFFNSGDKCTESIGNSKNLIKTICQMEKKSIWDFVKEQLLKIDKDVDCTEYQKVMMKASLIFAWEELERDEEQLCVELNSYI